MVFVVRMIRETNLFNTGFLEVKPKEMPIMEVPEVRAKFERLAETMRRRQQMEADALHAEQVVITCISIKSGK